MGISTSSNNVKNGLYYFDTYILTYYPKNKSNIDNFLLLCTVKEQAVFFS